LEETSRGVSSSERGGRARQERVAHASRVQMLGRLGLSASRGTNFFLALTYFHRRCLHLLNLKSPRTRNPFANSRDACATQRKKFSNAILSSETN
jgi:hypothetical protein